MIYLDNNGTTSVLPEVIEAMMPYFTTDWGNPSSSYKFGSKLKTVIETAGEQVADLIGAHPMKVIFTLALRWRPVWLDSAANSLVYTCRRARLEG